MTFIPSQGFRHAATLLLTNSARAIPAHASSSVVAAALEQPARDLVALAEDTRAPADASAWLIDEFHRVVARLPHVFDRESATRAGAAVLERVAQRTSDAKPCDLFLIYVPEDRLPIAAPLAVELTKRRVSVAFAEFEVASAAELATAIRRGLAHHRGGVMLVTPAFEAAAWTEPLTATDRLRLLRQQDFATAVGELQAWSETLRLSKL